MNTVSTAKPSYLRGEKAQNLNVAYNVLQSFALLNWAIYTPLNGLSCSCKCFKKSNYTIPILIEHKITDYWKISEYVWQSSVYIMWKVSIMTRINTTKITTWDVWQRTTISIMASYYTVSCKDIFNRTFTIQWTCAHERYQFCDTT